MHPERARRVRVPDLAVPPRARRVQAQAPDRAAQKRAQAALVQVPDLAVPPQACRVPAQEPDLAVPVHASTASAASEPRSAHR